MVGGRMEGKKGMEWAWGQLAGIILILLFLLAILYWYGSDLLGLIKKLFGMVLDF